MSKDTDESVLELQVSDDGKVTLIRKGAKIVLSVSICASLVGIASKWFPELRDGTLGLLREFIPEVLLSEPVYIIFLIVIGIVFYPVLNALLSLFWGETDFCIENARITRAYRKGIIDEDEYKKKTRDAWERSMKR